LAIPEKVLCTLGGVRRGLAALLALAVVASAAAAASPLAVTG